MDYEAFHAKYVIFKKEKIQWEVSIVQYTERESVSWLR